MPAAPGERCSERDAGCLGRGMKDTQGEMDGGVPGAGTERGAGPVAEGLHPLYGRRGRSAVRPLPRSRTVLPSGAAAGARPGPAQPGAGAAAGPPLAWSGSSGWGRLQWRFTMREDRA